MSQYGPQGDPVTIPTSQPAPTPATAPVAPAAAESLSPGVHLSGVTIGYQPGQQSAPEPTAEEVEAEARRAQDEERQRTERQAAALRRVEALLPEWENRAAGTLIKSDYQRGQRDNLLACIGEIRTLIDDKPGVPGTSAGIAR